LTGRLKIAALFTEEMTDARQLTDAVINQTLHLQSVSLILQEKYARMPRPKIAGHPGMARKISVL